jgi:hypothetical protein
MDPAAVSAADPERGVGVLQMADVTNPPERKLRLEQTGSSKTGGVPNTDTGGPVVDNNPAWPKRLTPWPFKAEDSSPLTWWRRLPPHAYRNAERLLLCTTLRGINVLHGGDDLAAAKRGDAAAAIGVALDLMPIEKFTLQVDITVTALMRTALDGDAASALVMAQIVGLTDLGHELTTELAASWLAYGERHSGEPNKFREAQLVLLASFERRRNKGDDA